MSSLSSWTFTPFPALPATLFPNVAFWNATNAATNLTYQIEVSWPFEWASRDVNKSALAMYVIDGNALGMTGSEGVKRRKPVDSAQPDTVVVSIGYPLSDSVYDLARRAVDFRPPLPEPQTPPSGADAFLDFIDGALRPWVRKTVFPHAHFKRDALYGHSFGGLFVVYALLADPNMFDTYLSASPALDWADAAILDMVTERFGNGTASASKNKPALVISYGSLEQFPERRRTETEAEFQARKSFIQPFGMTVHSHELYDRIRASGRTRDVVLKEYDGQDHSSVAASAVNDGLAYFVDW